MPVESLEEFGNRWRDRALEAELEIKRAVYATDCLPSMQRLLHLTDAGRDALAATAR